MIQTKRSVTKEISVLASPNDLAAALLGDAFDQAARIEVHVVDSSGKRGRIDLVELMIVQFTRRDLDEEPAPPRTMETAE